MQPPVLIVHGFLASPVLMTPLGRRLTSRGLDVRHPTLSPLVIQDVRRLAGQLDDAVAATGASRIDVVGASQGGIVALWWAHHLGGWDRIRRLVLLGAPVQGTPAARFALPLLGAWSRGIWQMLPRATLIRELIDPPVPNDAAVTTLALRGDPVCPPARCQLAGADNRVLPISLGPLTHQWLMLSPRVAETVGDLLTA